MVSSLCVMPSFLNNVLDLTLEKFDNCERTYGTDINGNAILLDEIH